MVLVGETDKLDPVPSSVPPHDPLYQFQVAPAPNVPPVIPKVELLPEQIVAGVAVALVAATELLLTVIVTLQQQLITLEPKVRVIIQHVKV